MIAVDFQELWELSKVQGSVTKLTLFEYLRRYTMVVVHTLTTSHSKRIKSIKQHFSKELKLENRTHPV